VRCCQVPIRSAKRRICQREKWPVRGPYQLLAIGPQADFVTVVTVLSRSDREALNGTSGCGGALLPGPYSEREAEDLPGWAALVTAAL
jgi:hypothetical protein